MSFNTAVDSTYQNFYGPPLLKAGKTKLPSACRKWSKWPQYLRLRPSCSASSWSGQSQSWEPESLSTPRISKHLQTWPGSFYPIIQESQMPAFHSPGRHLLHTPTPLKCMLKCKKLFWTMIVWPNIAHIGHQMIFLVVESTIWLVKVPFLWSFYCMCHHSWCFSSSFSQLVVSWKWGMGVPPSHHPFWWDFPHKNQAFWVDPPWKPSFCSPCLLVVKHGNGKFPQLNGRLIARGSIASCFLLWLISYFSTCCIHSEIQLLMVIMIIPTKYESH